MPSAALHRQACSAAANVGHGMRPLHPSLASCAPSLPALAAHTFPKEAYEILLYIARAYLSSILSLLYPLQSGRLAMRCAWCSVLGVCSMLRLRLWHAVALCWVCIGSGLPAAQGLLHDILCLRCCFCSAVHEMAAEFIKAAETLSTCLEQAAGCIDRGGDYVEALGAFCLFSGLLQA